VEEHEVTTSDGYILTLHRIPNGRNESASAAGEKKKTPVFLGHCLIGNSALYAFGPPENSLAYILADEGMAAY